MRDCISTHALTEGDHDSQAPVMGVWISTHALTEGDDQAKHDAKESGISTHALTEGDMGFTDAGRTISYFNSRPHGGRLRFGFVSERCSVFQLTPSRRATDFFSFSSYFIGISTHALTEGDRQGHFDVANVLNISTHALTEGDKPGRRLFFVLVIFQLTPSRRATYIKLLQRNTYIISTHALTEGDCLVSKNAERCCYFNSRPHGGRLKSASPAR